MKKTVVAILTAVVLMTGHATASVDTVDIDIDQIIADGEAALQTDPNNAEATRTLASAYSERGFLHYQKGDLDGAIKNYSQAIALDSNHLSAYIFRGLAYLFKNDLERAVADGEAALRIDPNNANAKQILSVMYSRYGEARLVGGDQIQAAACYKRSIELDSANDYSRHLLATLREEQRITSFNIDSVVTQLAATQQELSAAQVRADSIAAKAKSDSAAAQVKADSAAARLASAQERIAAAQRELAAANAKIDSVVDKARIDSTAARQELAAANAKIDSIAAKARADSIAAKVTVDSVAARLASVQEQIAAMRQELAAANAKVDSLILKVKADSVAAQSKLDSAVAKAIAEAAQKKSVVELRPSATDTVTVLAMEAIKTSAKQIAANLEKDTRVMIAAFTSSDENTSRYFMEELGYALYENGIVPVDRENLHFALRELGLQNINMDDEAALRDVGKLVYANVTLQGSLTDLGDIYRYGTTGTAVGTGLVVRPTRFNIIKDEATVRAIEALARQDLKSAADSRDQAIRDKPPSTAGEFLDRGMMFARLGDHARAIADFGEAQRLDPQMASTYFWHGNALRRSVAGAAPADSAETEERVRVFEEAIAALDRAIELDPEFTLAYTIRGAAYNDKGDALRALEDFKRALELNPALAEQIIEMAQQRLADVLPRDSVAADDPKQEDAPKPTRYKGKVRSGPVMSVSLQRVRYLGHATSDYKGTGISGGYAVSVPIYDKFSLETEVGYRYRSVKTERSGSELSITLTESEINLPIQLRYAFAPPGEFTSYFEAGTLFSFPFGTRVAFKNSDSKPVGVDGRENGIHLVCGAGITFKFGQVWYLGYRISVQLNKYVAGNHNHDGVGTHIQRSIGLSTLF